MSFNTFIPFRPPTVGRQNRPEVKILKADFGDGYTQYAPDGLNNIRKIVSVKWDGLTVNQAKSLTDFFEGQQGATPFWYQLSDDTTSYKWTCEAWDDTVDKGGLRIVTATFRQSFVLG